MDDFVPIIFSGDLCFIPSITIQWQVVLPYCKLFIYFWFEEKNHALLSLILLLHYRLSAKCTPYMLHCLLLFYSSATKM